MKSFKNLAFVTASLSLALLSACKENNEDIANVAAQRTIIANADFDTPMSRSAIDPTNYLDGAVGILWTPDDAIGVFSASDKNAEFKNTASTPKGRTVFSGSLAGDPLYAYYPYSGLNAGLSADALRGNLPLTQSYDPSTGIIEGDWKYGSPRQDAPEEFDFKHLFSLFKISVNASNTQMVGEKLRKVVLEFPEHRTLGGDFTFSAMTGEYSMPHTDGSNIITLQWNGDGLLSAGTTCTGYISCAPDIKADDEVIVKVVTDKRIAAFSAHAAYDFAASAIYTFDLNMAVLQQTFDVTYELIPVEPEEETANCYMITTAGEHDFKATVIGNGEKGIIPGAGFHTEDPYIDPKSARLLWEDTEGFVTDVKLVDGRVRYTTSGNVGNAVIAVYDGTDATSNILWSWHIWGVGPNLPTDESITNRVGATFNVMDRNLGAYPATDEERLETERTDVNEARALNCMLYQWGRKDPIPNASVYYVDGKSIDISSSYPVYTPQSASDATIATSIQHPDKMINRYTGSTDYNWLANANELLWGNKTNYGSDSQGAGWSDVKTIYDPSPVGYRVANRWVWTGFIAREDGSYTINGALDYRTDGTPTILEQAHVVLDYYMSGSTQRWIAKGFHQDRIGFAFNDSSSNKNKVFGYGYYFMKDDTDTEIGTYYPQSGYRFPNSNGSRTDYCLGGYYWQSCPYSTGAGAMTNSHFYYLTGSGNYKEPDKGLGSGSAGMHGSIKVLYNSYPWLGYAVRCVRE